MKFILPRPGTLALLATLLASAAQGAVTLSISGGSGTPLNFTLLQSITYTVVEEEEEESMAPLFIFEGTAGSSTYLAGNLTGDITFSINGIGNYPITQIFSGHTGGDMTADDIYLYGGLYPLNTGDVITISAGTLTTTESLPDAVPALSGGIAESFLTDGNGVRISPNAVPEPSAALLGATCIVGLLRRRRAA